MGMPRCRAGWSLRTSATSSVYPSRWAAPQVHPKSCLNFLHVFRHDRRRLCALLPNRSVRVPHQRGHDVAGTPIQAASGPPSGEGRSARGEATQAQVNKRQRRRIRDEHSDYRAHRTRPDPTLSIGDSRIGSARAIGHGAPSGCRAPLSSATVILLFPSPVPIR